MRQKWYLRYNLFYTNKKKKKIIMDIESKMINKYIKNKFLILDINKHINLYDIKLYYLEKNLIYIKIKNKSDINWNEDIRIRLFNINEDVYEDISIGSSERKEKDIEIYTDIDIEENKNIVRRNISNNIIYNNKIDDTNIIKYYNNENFIYRNKNYYINRNLEYIEEYILNNYLILKELNKYIINDEIKLMIEILIYLNNNGGIYVNKGIKNISLDDYNKDINICYKSKNIISIIFTKINFLDENKLFKDLQEKKIIEFSNYFKDVEIKEDNSLLEESNINYDYNYYSDIYIFEEYEFYILSRKNLKYKLEELQGNYYCLTSDDEIENDLRVEIINKNNNKKILLNDKLIKNKFKNNYIFKL